MSRARRWTVGALLLCLVLAAGGWVALISPQRAKAASLSAQVQAQQSSQQQLNTQLALLRNEARTLPHEEALLAKAQGYLPLAPQLPTLIRQLTALADGAGVDLVTVAPADPIPLTSSTASTASTPAASLYAVPLSLTVSGGYFQLENLLASMESLSRAVLVSSVSVAMGSGAAGRYPAAGTALTTAPTVGQGELTVAITAKAFMTTTDLVGAPAGAAATGTGK